MQGKTQVSVTLNEIFKEKDYILDAVEAWHCANPRIAIPKDADERTQLYMVVSAGSEQCIPNYGSLAMDLRNHFRCSIFVRDEEEISNEFLDTLFKFPEQQREIEKFLSGIKFAPPVRVEITEEDEKKHLELFKPQNRKRKTEDRSQEERAVSASSTKKQSKADSPSSSSNGSASGSPNDEALPNASSSGDLDIKS